MSDTVIIGEYELTEQPDSPEYDFGDTTRCFRTFEGAFGDCVAAAPSKGSTMEDTGSLVVVSSKVKKMPGGHGRLSIVLESTGFASSGGGDTEETYEVDWIEDERPLEANPYYMPGGTKPLTDRDIIDIALWRDERDPDLRAIFSYKTDGGNVLLLANAQDLAAKNLRGTETWKDYHPVARIKSLHDSMPDVQPCGVWTATKPFAKCPNGYTWFKSADRPTRTGRSGRWRRDIEWTGYKIIDTDLYVAAGGG